MRDRKKVVGGRQKPIYGKTRKKPEPDDLPKRVPKTGGGGSNLAKLTKKIGNSRL